MKLVGGTQFGDFGSQRARDTNKKRASSKRDEKQLLSSEPYFTMTAPGPFPASDMQSTPLICSGDCSGDPNVGSDYQPRSGHSVFTRAHKPTGCRGDSAGMVVERRGDTRPHREGPTAELPYASGV